MDRHTTPAAGTAAIVVVLALLAPASSRSAGGLDEPGEKPAPNGATAYGPPSCPPLAVREALAVNSQVDFNQKVTAGEPVAVSGCDWFPALGCTNRVDLTIKDSAGVTRSLGSAKPAGGGISIDSDARFLFGLVKTKVRGGGTVPQQTAPGNATVYGSQGVSVKLPLLGCTKLYTARAKTRPGLVVLPPTADSFAITNQAISGVRQGGQATLTWTQSRPAHARVSLIYRLTPGTPVDAGVPLDGDRPAGANTLAVPLSVGGKPLPAGAYTIRIELIDPPNSGILPARPKAIDFTVPFAP
jgi:hypothetical protein